MSLYETITKDMTSAMKAGDKFSLSVYRMLKSALQMEQINLKHELSDEEVISVIKKQVKIRKDSITEFTKYGRDEQASQLEKEIQVLSSYLPEQLSEEEVKEQIRLAMEEVKPTSMKDMGKVMSVLQKKIGSVADMSMVSALVKEKLM